MTDPIGTPPPPPSTAPKEPLLTVAVFTAIVGAILGTLAAFGLELTPEQRDALMQLAAVLGPPLAAFVMWLVGRLRVWSPASVERVTGEPVEVAQAALKRGQTIQEMPPGRVESARAEALLKGKTL